MVHPVAGDCPPQQFVAGEGSVHGQNVLNKCKVGSKINDVVDASEQRKNAEREGDQRFGHTGDHALVPLRSWSYFDLGRSNE